MMNNEMNIVSLKGIYNMKVFDLGKILKWFNRILKSVGSKEEMVAETRERGHKMQKKTVKPSSRWPVPLIVGRPP